MSIIDFETVNKYMLTTEFVSVIKKPDTNVLDNNDKCKEDGEVKITIRDNFFTPSQKDTLFWCFYVIKYGFSEYEFIGNKAFVKEKDEKFKLIEMLRSNIQLLKTKKVKNIKEHVEDELANKEMIHMKTFIALCIAHNLNVLFIHNRKCYDLCSVEGGKYHVIHYFDNSLKDKSYKVSNDYKANHYSYELNVPDEKLDEYKSNYFVWECMDKPLKSITAYKLEELVILCNQLHIQEKMKGFKKMNKKDLYELLVQTI